ncbi:MAG: biotin--[acetyl-CoA-carboxylase] ligase [Burkholderiales bacterium]|nr:biotin--[acetyl-CoA-carboxylase] ligase [Burkholderiales bacterium]
MNATAFQTLRALADGAFHSGEDIARLLGLTRSAVWYGIRDLNAAGLQVETVRGRGYRLARPLSLLDKTVVGQALGPLAGDFELEIVNSLESTNSTLLARAAEGAPSGLVLAAEQQLAGRGRRGRAWRSQMGHALTFSLLWRFSCGARELAGLSLAVGIALARALRAAGAAGARLKWPNDILLPEGKLAGILIEMQGDMLGPSAAVIGIGVNVRADAAVSAAVDQPVADLEGAAGMAVDRNALLAALLRELHGVINIVAARGFAPLRGEWQALHAFQDQPVSLLLPDGSELCGLARGVADDGALLLDTDGEITRHHSGECSLRAAQVAA